MNLGPALTIRIHGCQPGATVVWTTTTASTTVTSDDGRVGLRRHPPGAPSRASSPRRNVSLFLRDSRAAAMSGSVVVEVAIYCPSQPTLEPGALPGQCGDSNLLERDRDGNADPCSLRSFTESDVASEDERDRAAEKDADPNPAACFGRSRSSPLARGQRRRTPRLRADTRESPRDGSELQIVRDESSR